VYKEITAAPPGSSSSSGRNNNTAPVLYEARRGSGNIVVSVSNGRVFAQYLTRTTWRSDACHLCCGCHTVELLSPSAPAGTCAVNLPTPACLAQVKHRHCTATALLLLSALQIPIRFGNAPQCLKARASRCLEVRSVKCSQSSSSKDADMKVVQAKAASRTATAGTLQGGCNSAHGTYLVVVGLPSAAGRYRCSVTFNDDWENRPLANLRVT
jgi:hypothetical protein